MVQNSFIFAIGSVGTKLGNGITAAVLTQLLAFSGYVSKAGVTTQPQSVVNMIMNIYKVGPLIVWVTVVIILLLYRLDKKYPMIMKELEEREEEANYKNFAQCVLEHKKGIRDV